MDIPLVEGLDSADHCRDVTTPCTACHHPISVGQQLRSKIVHRIVANHCRVLPDLFGFVRVESM